MKLSKDKITYKINVFRSDQNENVGSISSTNFENHEELNTLKSKLFNSDLHSNCFIFQKEKAFEIPFMHYSDCEDDLSSISSSRDENIYKEELLSEGFNSSTIINNL